MVDKFKEAQILFNGSYDLLDKKDDDIDGICEQELISFAKNLDQTFAKFIREAQGEEGYSFAFRYVEDYVETKDGEMEVFGFKISDAVKFMNKLGISLGWLKAFVPEIAEMEADVAQE